MEDRFDWSMPCITHLVILHAFLRRSQLLLRISRHQVVHICFVRPMDGTVGNVVGKLHYMHWAVHGSETIGIKTAESTLLLDALEHEFPEVFV